jgi:hypothetical protein
MFLWFWSRNGFDRPLLHLGVIHNSHDVDPTHIWTLVLQHYQPFDTKYNHLPRTPYNKLWQEQAQVTTQMSGRVIYSFWHASSGLESNLPSPTPKSLICSCTLSRPVLLVSLKTTPHRRKSTRRAKYGWRTVSVGARHCLSFARNNLYWALANSTT